MTARATDSEATDDRPEVASTVAIVRAMALTRQQVTRRRRATAKKEELKTKIHVPPMSISWKTEHPYDGGSASDGTAYGDELIAFHQDGSKYDIARRFRDVGQQFAGHERPEEIEVSVFVLIRRKGKVSK